MEGKRPSGVGGQTIELDGTFDAQAAERFARALEAIPSGIPVLVDLTRVRDFHDSCVAVLARSLRTRPHVAVSGLRTHHVRLLEYLGVDLAGACSGTSPRWWARHPSG